MPPIQWIGFILLLAIVILIFAGGIIAALGGIIAALQQITYYAGWRN